MELVLLFMLSLGALWAVSCTVANGVAHAAAPDGSGQVVADGTPVDDLLVEGVNTIVGTGERVDEFANAHPCAIIVAEPVVDQDGNRVRTLFAFPRSRYFQAEYPFFSNITGFRLYETRSYVVVCRAELIGQ